MSGRKIIEGLKQSLAHAQGDPTHVRERVLHVPETVDVRSIRKRLDLTQEEFALKYGFSLSAVRHWEQGTRQPETAARVLLLVIDRASEAVDQALYGATAEKARTRI